MPSQEGRAGKGIPGPLNTFCVTCLLVGGPAAGAEGQAPFSTSGILAPPLTKLTFAKFPNVSPQFPLRSIVSNDRFSFIGVLAGIKLVTSEH